MTMSIIPQRVDDPVKVQWKPPASNQPQDKKEVIIEEIRELPSTESLIGDLSSTNAKTRFDAVKQLCESEDPAVFSSLVECLLNGSTTACSAAAALGLIGNAKAIEPLTKVLKPNDPILSKYSIIALGRLLNNETDSASLELVTKSLIDCLQYEGCRQSAAITLGKLGKKEANEVLVKCLGDEDGETREKARELLFKNRDEKTLNLLAKCLTNNESNKARLNAAWLLGELGSMDTKLVSSEITDTLIAKCLEDNDVVVRSYAAEALGKIGIKKAVPALVKCLKDKHPSPRRFALEALGRIKDPNAISSMVKCFENNNPQALLDDIKDSHEVSWFAARALDNMGQPTIVVESLINSLSNNDPLIRVYSLETLLNIDDENIVPLLKNAAEFYSRSLKNLLDVYHVKPSQAIQMAPIDPIIKCLDDNEPLIPHLAIILLGRIGNQKAVEPLTKYLKSSESLIRRLAADALGILANPKAIVPLANRLNNEGDFDVSLAIVNALASIKDPTIFEPLVNKLLTTTDIKLGSFIFGQLVSLEDSAMIPPLVKALSNNDQLVQGRVLETMGALSKNHLNILLVGLHECLDNNDENISKKVKTLLGIITGEIKASSDQEVLQLLEKA